MNKIVISGASGYVGARMYQDLRRHFDVIGLYHSTKLFPELVKLDVTERSTVVDKIAEIEPDWIIHVAADPSSSSCDADPEKAIRLNEGGTENIVEAANAIGAKVIYISSVAAITQVDLYGRTKAEGEKFVKKTNAGWDILRPSLIVGYSPNTKNDRSFNRFLRAITDHAPAVYDTSWKFQPTYLGQISEVIEGIIEKNITGEIIPITKPEKKTRFDLAHDILSPFGIEVLPKDDNDRTPLVKLSQSELEKLGLPIYNYAEMIEMIVKETKEALEIR